MYCSPRESSRYGLFCVGVGVTPLVYVAVGVLLLFGVGVMLVDTGDSCTGGKEVGLTVMILIC